MRPITVRVSSATFSPWIPVNRLQRSFGVGIGCYISSGAVLTYSVQHTFDALYLDPNPTNFVKIVRTTTSANVLKVNHGLSVGDWAKITNSGSSNLDFAEKGVAVATVVDADNFTYTVANSGTAADNGFATLQSARVFDNVILSGVSLRGDTNYSAPVVAVRLIVTAYTSGFVDMDVIQGI